MLQQAHRKKSVSPHCECKKCNRCFFFDACGILISQGMPLSKTVSRSAILHERNYRWLYTWFTAPQKLLRLTLQEKRMHCEIVKCVSPVISGLSFLWCRFCMSDLTFSILLSNMQENSTVTSTAEGFITTQAWLYALNSERSRCLSDSLCFYLFLGTISRCAGWPQKAWLVDIVEYQACILVQTHLMIYKQ